MNHFYYPPISANAFVKYHGNGNDFIIFDSAMVNGSWYLENAQWLCDRHYGIGADGIIVLSRKDDYVQMTIINADGTEANNCGNGLRCAAAYTFGSSNLSEVLIKLAQRTYICQKINNKISVAMGECFIAQQKELFLQSCGQMAQVSLGLMGNEHLIFFLSHPVYCFDEMKNEIKSRLKISDDINIGFVFEKEPKRFFSKVFERGVGFTNSCGTGACAAASFIAFLFPHHAKDEIIISQPGGELNIMVNVKTKDCHQASYNVTQIGEAREVFYGYLPIDCKLLKQNEQSLNRI